MISQTEHKYHSTIISHFLQNEKPRACPFAVQKGSFCNDVRFCLVQNYAKRVADLGNEKPTIT